MTYDVLHMIYDIWYMAQDLYNVWYMTYDKCKQAYVECGWQL